MCYFFILTDEKLNEIKAVNPLVPKLLLIFFFGSKQDGEGETYVHDTYGNANSPSFYRTFVAIVKDSFINFEDEKRKIEKNDG